MNDKVGIHTILWGLRYKQYLKLNVRKIISEINLCAFSMVLRWTENDLGQDWKTINKYKPNFLCADTEV